MKLVQEKCDWTEKVSLEADFGTFHLVFSLSCAINSIGYAIDGTRQLWKTSEMYQNK